jgi:hypothetical protein
LDFGLIRVASVPEPRRVQGGRVAREKWRGMSTGKDKTKEWGFLKNWEWTAVICYAKRSSNKIRLDI